MQIFSGILLYSLYTYGSSSILQTSHPSEKPTNTGKICSNDYEFRRRENLSNLSIIQQKFYARKYVSGSNILYDMNQLAVILPTIDIIKIKVATFKLSRKGKAPLTGCIRSDFPFKIRHDATTIYDVLFFRLFENIPRLKFVVKIGK